MKWKIQHEGQDTWSGTIEPKVCLAFELDTSNERDCGHTHTHIGTFARRTTRAMEYNSRST